MNKIAIAFVTAAALVAGTPLLMTTPASAQVDVQVGGDHDHDRDRDHAHGPAIVVGQPHCHTVTIVERHDGQKVTRTERKCD
jgi:hypothetical protein